MKKLENSFCQRDSGTPILVFASKADGAFHLLQCSKGAQLKHRLKLCDSDKAFRKRFQEMFSDGQPGLSIIDLDSPSGRGLFSWCRVQPQKLPLVALLSDGALGATLNAFEAGAAAVLVKPISGAEFNEVICRVDYLHCCVPK